MEIHAIAVVPAAGKGQRFAASLAGRPSASGSSVVKLAALIDGQSVLDRTLASVLEAGVPETVVVLPPHAEALVAATTRLADPRVRTAINPDPARGMFSSIQIGLDHAAGDPILFMPADMPFVRPDTIVAVIAACRRLDRPVSPRYHGHRGHPLALPGRLRDEILSAPATNSLSALLGHHERQFVDVLDAGVLRDVDTVDDLTG